MVADDDYDGYDRDGVDSGGKRVMIVEWRRNEDSSSSMPV
jgi:hypothetical protein